MLAGAPIEKLNLGGCRKLTGTSRQLRCSNLRCCLSDGPRPQDITLGLVKLQCMVESLLIHTLFASVGNIGALKGMPLTFLNLSQTGLKGRPKYQS